MSCVALDDLTSAMLHILSTDTLRGPVNVVCPEPVRNAQFTRLLGRLLHRPAFFPVPVPLLRILFGELADVVLAASQRVTPAALTAGGYVFRHPTVHSALSAALGERAAG
jgi:NAD dependent epimerase/dehydratase family enzyme